MFGVSYETLKATLEQFGKVDCVGVSFGVIKLTTPCGQSFDFSLPRKDSKNGVGHKGFSVEVDHELTPKEAASRRDFTINSMSYDPLTGEIVDHFNGLTDLTFRILTPTSSAFTEDPLRILRGFQFAARFGCCASEELRDIAPICVAEFDTLPPSRIWEEWNKWIQKGVYYTSSIRYLCNVMPSVYPEITGLSVVDQDPTWHPEGNVLTHTGHVLNYMARYCTTHNISRDRRTILILAALCHDFGKFTHTKVVDGKIKSIGHEYAGVEPTIKFLASIGCPKTFIKPICGLVRNHMAVVKPTAKSVRRLANRLANYNTCIGDLAILIEADKSGRPPLPQGQPQCVVDMLQLSEKDGCTWKRQHALVSGGAIAELGYVGPMIGKIQRKLYEMQLNGSFETAEQGIAHIKGIIEGL